MTETHSADVAILATNNLRRDARVLKEATSLHERGLRVECLGLATETGDSVFEQAPFGTIRRIPLNARAGRTTTDAAEAAARAYRGRVGDLRHWAGRLRSNLRMYKALSEDPPRVVISCDLDTLIAGWLLKRLRGAYLVYDAHELWTEMSSSSSEFFKRLYALTENFLSRRADLVVTVNDALADELMRRYGIRRPLVVLNGSREVVGNASGGEMPIKVLYQGGYAVERGLEELVLGAGCLRGTATLTLQGFGDLESHLRGLASSAGVEDVVAFVQPCSPTEVVASAALYDVGLIPYRATNLNNRLATPNKLFDYMAAGVAVVASSSPEMGRILASCDCGVYVSTDCMQDMLAAVDALGHDSNRLAAMKRNAASAGERFAWDNQIRPLSDVVVDVVHGGSAVTL